MSDETRPIRKAWSWTIEQNEADVPRVMREVLDAIEELARPLRIEITQYVEPGQFEDREPNE